MACTKCKKKTVIEQTAPDETDNLIVSNFKLRNVLGAIQMSFGSGQFITNANLTDTLAIEFLAANPNRISMFEIYPADWKELILPESTNEIENENE